MKLNYAKLFLILFIPIFVFAGILALTTNPESFPGNSNVYQAIWGSAAISFCVSLLLLILIKSIMGSLTENKIAALYLLAVLFVFLSIGATMGGEMLAGFT